MAEPVSRPAEQTGRRGRLWSLPPGGYRNGLDDEAWTLVLEVSERAVPTVLCALAEADVPAYAVPASSGASRLNDHAGRPEPYQLWVGASASGRAEMTLARLMPYLTQDKALSSSSQAPSR
jgi:hypothetical protein